MNQHGVFQNVRFVVEKQNSQPLFSLITQKIALVLLVKIVGQVQNGIEMNTKLSRIGTGGLAMKKLEVMRCPNCGTVYPSPVLNILTWRHWWNRKHYIYCPYCMYCGGLAYTARGAKKRWNDDIRRLRLHQDGQLDGGVRDADR